MRHNMIQADYRACIALADARKRENAAARARCLASPVLGAVLLDAARRRGLASVDWVEYFVSVGIAS
jgi:hypothetical protein